ncbi:hypothetical protein [Microbacterium sp. NPDC096154]
MGLWLNDRVVDATEDDAFAHVVGVASGQIDLDVSAAWFAERMRQRMSER